MLKIKDYCYERSLITIGIIVGMVTGMIVSGLILLLVGIVLW